MISYLKGILVEKNSGAVVLEVGGVGYYLNIPYSTFSELPPLYEKVKLWTYLHVREGSLSLFGFGTLEEREMFVTLISISSVGPKLALAILSQMEMSRLKLDIREENVQNLIKVSGVGKKTAQRIILELKDKLDKMADMDSLLGRKTETKKDNRLEEAVAALKTLGYNNYEVRKALNHVLTSTAEEQSLEDIIEKSLKYFANNW